MLSLPADAVLSCLVWIQARLPSERGQTLGEYALLISLVAIGTTLIALIAFRNQLSTGVDQMSACLTGRCG